MRPTILRVVMFSTLLLFCNAMTAQQSSQPSQELQNLTKALSGEWSLSVKFEPNASIPNGLTNTGTETWRAGPGGFALLEEEHLQMPKGDLFLLGTIWWNAQTHSFHGMECQNLLPYTCDVKGSLTDITMSWDGKQFAIEELETHNGKKSMWHEVWSDITPTSFTQTGESSDPGGPRKRLFTIHATRVTDSSSRNDIPVAGVENPFVGTWKTNTSKTSTRLGVTVTYSESAGGKLHYSSGNRGYDFAIDGKEYSTGRPASTVACNKVGESAWECTERISERITRKINLALSSDRQTLTTTYTWFNPGNRMAHGSTAYTRTSAGLGLEGTWKVVKSVADPDIVTLAFPVPGQMYFYLDPDGATWAGPTDGTFMAVHSTMSPPGLSWAYRVVNPRKMSLEFQREGRIFTVGTMDVSEDGKTLTRTLWSPGKEDQKNVLVMDKQWGP